LGEDLTQGEAEPVCPLLIGRLEALREAAQEFDDDRYCEERSDEAIQTKREILDCFAFGSQ
jgi:hypothetical protein